LLPLCSYNKIERFIKKRRLCKLEKMVNLKEQFQDKYKLYSGIKIGHSVLDTEGVTDYLKSALVKWSSETLNPSHRHFSGIIPTISDPKKMNSLLLEYLF